MEYKSKTTYEKCFVEKDKNDFSNSTHGCNTYTVTKNMNGEKSCKCYGWYKYVNSDKKELYDISDKQCKYFIDYKST